MAAAKRIYTVTQTSDDGAVKVALVRATNSAQAIKHVAQPQFKADVASQDDLVKLAKTCEVQDATE